MIRILYIYRTSFLHTCMHACMYVCMYVYFTNMQKKNRFLSQNAVNKTKSTEKTYNDLCMHIQLVSTPILYQNHKFLLFIY